MPKVSFLRSRRDCADQGFGFALTPRVRADQGFRLRSRRECVQVVVSFLRSRRECVQIKDFGFAFAPGVRANQGFCLRSRRVCVQINDYLVCAQHRGAVSMPENHDLYSIKLVFDAGSVFERQFRILIASKHAVREQIRSNIVIWKIRSNYSKMRQIYRRFFLGYGTEVEVERGCAGKISKTVLKSHIRAMEAKCGGAPHFARPMLNLVQHLKFSAVPCAAGEKQKKTFVKI